ncbi:TetR/AcrR family transcriptional regulator [Sphingobium chlorophenolicum]|uniref:Regulatory protein TetR n=1 Tax=Sphingobium chlorophenolicum TaxID=46429 RepID=A0A081RGT0_SPHCR|nr:TetR/AcrR family transcriptional regulator [Sphingobium chlorophenolicum]KEQ54403.1 Regulatory protein TetR [Sphingobium chlorophenolicum]
MPDEAIAKPRRGRPTNADAPVREAELIDAAARAFLKHGYAGASMDHIAMAARVSKATIYARFGNKTALFEAVALHTVSSMRSDVRNIATEGREPANVLTDFALRIAGEVAEAERIALLRLAIAAKERFPDIARRLHSHIADTVAPITAYLTQLRGAGYRIDDPALLAQHFINLANGGLRFLLTDDFAEEAFRRTWASGVVALFLRGMEG